MQTWEALALLRRQDGDSDIQSPHDAKQFARLLEQARYSSPPTPPGERRKEERYIAMEPAVITRYRPPSPAAIQGTVVDISKSGLRIQSPVDVPRGSEILIGVERAAIFGTVRYSRSHGEIFFDIGLSVAKVVTGEDTNSAMDALKNELDGGARVPVKDPEFAGEQSSRPTNIPAMF